MNFADLLEIVRKRWLSIALITAVGLAAAGLYSLTRTPLYTTSSEVFVSFRAAQSTSDLTNGATFVQRQVASYTSLVGGERVLQPVIDKLGLSSTPAQLAQRVTATSPVDTVLIQISATDEDPQMAARIADATAESLSAEVTRLESPGDGAESPVLLRITKNAVAPTSASYPNTSLLLVTGLLVGLVLGLAVSVLREIADTRVRSGHDVKALTDAVVLGQISLDESAEASPLVVQTSPYHSRSEAFRRLRTNLQFLDIDGGPQAIVVTSSVPNEGKSTTAINLAITLADADANVLLVDADLRRPSVAHYLSIEGSVGLTTVLIHKAELEDVIQPWGSAGLFVIPSGAVPPNPAELVGSRAMAQLVEKVKEKFDYVIIDTPPLLPVTDAALIAKMTNGALMLAGSGIVRRDQLRQSLENLDAVNARTLGIVLNKIGRDGQSYGYGAKYGYYSHEPTGDREDASWGGEAGKPWLTRLKNWAIPRLGLPYAVDESGRSGEAPQHARTSGRHVNAHAERPAESAASRPVPPPPPPGPSETGPDSDYSRVGAPWMSHSSAAASPERDGSE